MQKGYKHTKETIEKFKLIALTRDNTNRLKSLPKKEKHWNWSERPSVLAMHKRIHRACGRARDRECLEKCGKMARDWALVAKTYSDNVEDYKPLCRSCHVKKDKNWLKK